MSSDEETKCKHDEPKWWLLHATNYLVALVFVASVFYHVKKGSGQKRDATSLLPVLLIWCGCMAYFFGFFGISFVDKDEDLFFSPVLDENLAPIPEEEDSISTPSKSQQTFWSKQDKEENPALLAASFRRQGDAARAALAVHMKHYFIHYKIEGHDILVPYTQTFSNLKNAAQAIRLSGGVRTTTSHKPSTYIAAATWTFANVAEAQAQKIGIQHGRTLYYQTEPAAEKPLLPQLNTKLCARIHIETPAAIKISGELIIPGPILKKCFNITVSEICSAYAKTARYAIFQPPNLALVDLFTQTLALGLPPKVDFSSFEPIAGGRDLRLSCAITIDTTIINRADNSLSSLPIKLVHATFPALPHIAVTTVLADHLQHFASLIVASSTSPGVSSLAKTLLPRRASSV